MVQPLWKTVWQFFKKLKTELPYDTITNPTSGHTSKRIHRKVSKRCLHIQVPELFTEPRGESNPSVWMHKQNVVYSHKRILCSLKKEGNPVICYNMNQL